MSNNTEVMLGAHLYVAATESDLPHLLKHGGEYASKDDLAGLGNAFRNAAKWMVNKKVVFLDDERKWQINDDVLDGLTEAENKEFTPHYDTVVKAHLPVLDIIENAGKFDYVKSFREIHKPVDFEIEPETSAVLTDESMANITAASLNLLAAVQKDPANATFINGLNSLDLENLHDSLADANYLMPEDAPEDRTAPLGEQSLRGSQEQREAIFENATVLASNLSLPDSIQQGDAPMMAAMMIKNAVSGAEIEHVVVESSADLDAPNPWNSDLMREDAQMINKVLLSGTKLVNGSQFDTEDIDNILIKREDLENLTDVMAEFDDANIDHVLKRRDFMAPGMSASTAKQISKSMAILTEITKYDHEEAQILADEGGSSTESGYEEEAGLEEGGLEGDSERDDEIIDDIEAGVSGLTNDDREEALGYVDPFVKVSRELMDRWDNASVGMIAGGVDQTLSILAGEDENSVGALRSGVDRAAFATFQEAARGGSMGHANVTLYSDTMSFRRLNEMNPAMQAQFTGKRIIKIEPGNGFLEGTDYKPVSSEAAAARVSNFVQENMIVDGEPNKLLRATLREMAQKPVVAATTAEAAAWKNEALAFTERDEEEQTLRREVVEKKKQGLYYAHIDAETAKKFVDITTASSGNDPARVSFDSEGNVSITHPEGPTMNSSIENPPKELQASGKSGRTFGGMIDPKRIRAALESSPNSKGITLVMSGETPKGVIARVNDAHTQVKEADRFPDMALT